MCSPGSGSPSRSNRELVIAPVHVGRGCFVGTGSVLRKDTVMEDGARLEELSLLTTGGRIQRDETWVNSAPSAELAARVSKWTFWTWFREPLDIISFLFSLLACIG